MDLIKQKISRFDQVRILRTVNVNYLSAPPGSEIDPKGLWSVAAIVGQDDLLCVKNQIVIRIKAVDVAKVKEFNIQDIKNDLGGLLRGKR